MKSRTAKVLHEVAGRSMIGHVVANALGAGASPVVNVVGVQSDSVREHLAEAFPGVDLRYAEQPERKGTGDAVARAKNALRGFSGDALILCGDVPALGKEALRALARRHRRSGAALTVLSAELPDPTGYGRVVRDAKGRIEAIVEHKDASEEVRAIREINTGTYCADWKALAAALREIKPDNAQGEYYLTDAVRLLLAKGKKVEAVVHPAPDECEGVNGRAQLAEVGLTMSRRKIAELQARGVTVIDPATTWIHESVKVGRDSVIYPGVQLEGSTAIGEGVVIHSGSRLRDVKVGARALVKDHTVAESAEIGKGTSVGPFAHLRPGTRLGEACKIGNFVETKKARFGKGSKASHLAYIGDAEVGKECNIGAGTITCNYDGVNKHLTELKDGVFIGSDTQLVAPVKVGKGSYVGAGTTLTKDVPPGALAISRTPEKILEGWVERKRRQQAEEKARRQKKG